MNGNGVVVICREYNWCYFLFYLYGSMRECFPCLLEPCLTFSLVDYYFCKLKLNILNVI